MNVFVFGVRGIPNILGGIETHCEHLYPLLVEKGIDVTILARSPYVKDRSMYYKGVKVKSIFCFKNKNLNLICFFQKPNPNSDSIPAGSAGVS